MTWDYLVAHARTVMRRLWLLMRPVRPVVSLAKPDGRNAPAVWRDPAEADGWQWRNALHEMLHPVNLVKSIEMQYARRVHRAILAEERATRERSITDELGTWDPDTVDWLEPAVYREAGLAVLQRGLFRGVVRFNPQLIAHAMDLALST